MSQRKLTTTKRKFTPPDRAVTWLCGCFRKAPPQGKSNTYLRTFGRQIRWMEFHT